MAFSVGIGDRIKSPRDESSSFGPLASPLRSIGNQMASSSSDARGQLHRRFTTNNIPTLSTPLSPIGQQRRQAAEPAEFTTATYHKLQVLEKKKLEYEYLKEQRRRFEAEMELIDLQSRRDEEEINRLSTDIRYGKHSQPTTPPEYSNASKGFPTSLSRPNRFSMSSINGLTTPRSAHSGSQLASPPSAPANTNGFLSAKSMPGSRRNSDEDGDDFDNDDFNPPTQYRNTNRMSMPAKFERGLPALADVLGTIDTHAYLFDDDENQQNHLSSPEAKSYLQMNTTDDKFPILVRRNANGTNMELSASSAALDLALSQSPGPDNQPNGSNGWSARHRQAQQSLPTNTYRKASQVEEYEASKDSTPPSKANGNRRSVEFSLSPMASAGKRSSFAKLQQSFSSNDVPTLKNGEGANGMNGNSVNAHAEQHLHNHNAGLGRIPPNVMNRHSRELSNGFNSGLHASAAPFGPAITSAAPGSVASTIGSPTMSQYSTASTPAPYYGYGMSMLNNAMGGMSLGGAPGNYNGNYNQNAMYNPQGGMTTPFYGSPYAAYGPNGRVQDSQARVIQSRRMQSDANRFVNYDLKTMPRTEIYALCKDQHGCRFLQKKLEDRNPEYLQIIFDETAGHVVELMTDPFGNYLCQKLLEYTNNEQRNTLVRNAASSLVSIALNQHGTRALQKMIEFISTPEQIQMIMNALRDQVVDLIQDLNGNHVIQKCLNHLKAEDAQFIFDAVGEHCITVGTHRHGCCVLQRCIDHASGFQKVQLVGRITANSFNLVQDPFGNYVVQYILDLNEPSFTNPLCHGFQGKIAELSKQKFSSNVIEKCMRCADGPTKSMMIEELMDPNELEKLMRDSYGNYVIQTALEFAPAEMCVHLIDAMRPILPGIRQTPYGRRIQGKVQERESRLHVFTGRSSGHGTPLQLTAPPSEQIPAFAGQVSAGYPGAPMYTNAATFGANIVSPQPHRLSNPPLPSHLQSSVQQQGYQTYGGASANVNGNGMGNFF
ncbi:unnamed protein product [Periconia digitata]|uniref:PUM-HD domain-containing protein n=1 Tax=Periconia digitata TaxID=1303443 RepID=A0A9W4UCX4_9PLEO|nr:unnamed protein product [Periconia digitata]